MLMAGVHGVALLLIIFRGQLKQTIHVQTERVLTIPVQMGLVIKKTPVVQMEVVMRRTQHVIQPVPKQILRVANALHALNTLVVELVDCSCRLELVQEQEREQEVDSVHEQEKEHGHGQGAAPEPAHVPDL